MRERKVSALIDMINISVYVFCVLCGFAIGCRIRWGTRKHKKYDGTLLIGPNNAHLNVDISFDELRQRDSIELEVHHTNYDIFTEDHLSCNEEE